MNFIRTLNREFFNAVPVIGRFGSLPVRHRYWADKIAKGPLIKNFDYKDKIFKGGYLPRLENVDKLPKPDYRPKNCWSKKRALFGQNDYIDILGNNKLHPVKVSYDVPVWLRGKEGNEMQILLTKLRSLHRGPYKEEYPTNWEKMNKRLRYLYCFLNRKKRQHFLKR